MLVVLGQGNEELGLDRRLQHLIVSASSVPPGDISRNGPSVPAPVTEVECTNAAVETQLATSRARRRNIKEGRQWHRGRVTASRVRGTRCTSIATPTASASRHNRDWPFRPTHCI